MVDTVYIIISYRDVPTEPGERLKTGHKGKKENQIPGYRNIPRKRSFDNVNL